MCLPGIAISMVVAVLAALVATVIGQAPGVAGDVPPRRDRRQRHVRRPRGVDGVVDPQRRGRADDQPAGLHAADGRHVRRSLPERAQEYVALTPGGALDALARLSWGARRRRARRRDRGRRCGPPGRLDRAALDAMGAACVDPPRLATMKLPGLRRTSVEWVDLYTRQTLLALLLADRWSSCSSAATATSPRSTPARWPPWWSSPSAVLAVGTWAQRAVPTPGPRSRTDADASGAAPCAPSAWRRRRGRHPARGPAHGRAGDGLGRASCYSLSGLRDRRHLGRARSSC